MLKTDYPIYFDDVALVINKKSWNRQDTNVSSSNQTEDGGDHVEYLRFGKTTISASFRVTDEWASILAGFRKKTSFTAKFYDIETKAYVEKTVRMEGFKANEIKGSDRLNATNGVYDVSFSLVEY